MVLRGDGGVFCSGADLKYIRARRRRATSGTCARRAAERRLRRGLQADPRVPPLDDLRDPARAQAVDRRGRRRGGRRRARPRHGLRPRGRLRARDLRVGVRQDRAHRRRATTFFLPRLVGPPQGARARCSSTRGCRRAQALAMGLDHRRHPDEELRGRGGRSWRRRLAAGPTARLGHRQAPDQPRRRGGPARLPPRRGAAQPRADRRRPRLRRGPRRLLREAGAEVRGGD